MIVNASQAPDSSLVENSDRAAPAKSADAGVDFAALLFLVLGVPQIPSMTTEGDPQATVSLNGLAGSPVGAMPGQLVDGQIPFDPTATQASPTPSQDQVNVDGVIASLQQLLAPIVPAANGTDTVMDNPAASSVAFSTPSAGTPVTAATDASSLVTPSLIAGEPQIALQDGPTPANSEGFGQLIAQAPNAQSQQANAKIIQLPEDPSDATIGQGLSTDTTLNAKTIPDPNGTSIVVPDGDPVARPNEGSVINSDNRPAVEQSYKATVMNGTQPADPNSSSRAANIAAQDNHSPKRTDGAPVVENSTNTSHSTVTTTTAGSKDSATTQEQNPGFRFDNHGEKTSHENVGTSHDPYSRLNSASAVLTPNGAANAQELGTPDAKPAGNLSPVIEQIANNIAANVSQNRHEAVITLNPPELGSLKINLSLDGGKLQVHIIAEAHESRALIENHLSELKQALQRS